MADPILESMTLKFSQEANTTTPSKYGVETLTIEAHSSLGIDRDRGAFYILKTNGWSIDDEQDIKKLMDRIERIIKPHEKL